MVERGEAIICCIMYTIDLGVFAFISLFFYLFTIFELASGQYGVRQMVIFFRPQPHGENRGTMGTRVIIYDKHFNRMPTCTTQLFSPSDKISSQDGLTLDVRTSSAGRLIEPVRILARETHKK